MSAVDLAVARLKTEEGFRALPYVDTTGHLTVGYGFQIAAGLSKYTAGVLLVAQCTERMKALMEYEWFAGIDEIRQSAFLDFAINLGLSGLLHFPKAIAAASIGDWKTCSAELLASKAYKQEPGRVKMLADIVLSGVNA